MEITTTQVFGILLASLITALLAFRLAKELAR